MQGKQEKQKLGEEEDLFRLVVVNSYGSQEVQRLKDDDSIPLKLGSESMCVLREEGGVWGLAWITVLLYLLLCCILRPDVHFM